jgi:hypothetical protein
MTEVWIAQGLRARGSFRVWLHCCASGTLPQAAGASYSRDVLIGLKVLKERMRIVYLAALVLAAAGCGGYGRAQAVSPASSLPQEPPPSSAGIFPLAQVERGQHGVAYTVFAGAVPEPMGVEILGVLHNALGPGEDMILARLTGAKAEYTGVVAGMSGSPVYIDGKLAGALAFRIGQFSKEPIAGITPIERMLEVRDLPRTPASPEQASALPYAGLGGKADGAAKAAEMIRPIDTPLVFSGFSPASLDLWRAQSPVAGLEPVAGLGGASSGDGKTVQQPEPLIPGSAVSALLVEGDLEIAATCTVTYIDAKRLLACGHPITQFGAVSMPMTKANIVATLPSPLNAFKIVNTTDQVGSFTEDRQTAIGGLLGEPARMIPLTVHMTEAGKAGRTLHLRVVDQPQITPTAVLVSVFQGLSEANAYAAQDSYRLSGAIRIAGFPPVELNSLAVPGDLGPANLMAALEVGSRFTRLYDNAGRRVPIESVELKIERLPERLTVQLERAEADRTTVHAGEQLTVYATLRPWHGEVQSVPLTVTLPASLPEGPVRLLVSDGATLDRLAQSPRSGQTLDLAGTIAQLNGVHREDRLYVTLLTGDAEAVVDGRVLASLPASMANIYEPLHADQKAALSGESLLELASAPAGAQLTGQQVILLRVE